MKNSWFVGIFLSILVLNSFAFAAAQKLDELPTHAPDYNQTVQALLYYHNSGKYEKDVKDVLNTAQRQLTTIIKTTPHDKKLAIVFDIDETALSNWQSLQQSDFAYIPAQWQSWKDAAQAPAIKPTLKLYQYVLKNNVTIFFVTARLESERQATVKDLTKAGFTKYQALYMRSEDAKTENIATYKTNTRKLIESQGYHIVMNIGDQYSDLCGGYAEVTVKVPNPFYYIPGCSVKELCKQVPVNPYYGTDWNKMCPIIYQ